MKLASIRFSLVAQTSRDFSRGTVHSINMGDSYGDIFQSYTRIEIVTVGWTSGVRIRSRSFLDSDKLFAYFNKLFAGGYFSDEEYHDAWCRAERALGSSIDVRSLCSGQGTTQYSRFDPRCLGVIWELFPWDFVRLAVSEKGSL